MADQLGLGPPKTIHGVTEALQEGPDEAVVTCSTVAAETERNSVLR